MNDNILRLKKYLESHDYVIVPDSQALRQQLLPYNFSVYQLLCKKNDSSGLLLVRPDDIPAAEFNRIIEGYTPIRLNLTDFDFVASPNGNMDRMAFQRKGISWLK